MTNSKFECFFGRVRLIWEKSSHLHKQAEVRKALTESGSFRDAMTKEQFAVQTMQFVA